MTSGDDDGVSPLAGVGSGGGGGGPLTPQDGPIPTSFYNDSSDNLSSALASPLSPVFRQPAPMRPVPSFPPHDAQHDMAPLDNDDRRPSLASIATSSSTGSRNSGVRRGGLQKLQGFFGEQFPGRDGSETSLQSSLAGTGTGTGAGAGAGKDRSRSYSHSRPTRERNYSNATDHTRDASPASSRPRTPVPAPEVVPFLYQNSDVSHVLFLSHDTQGAKVPRCPRLPPKAVTKALLPRLSPSFATRLSPSLATRPCYQACHPSSCYPRPIHHLPPKAAISCR